MADDLNAVVQRMIDAGESEENIGSVIQHYKASYRPDPTMQAATARAIATEAGMLGVGVPQEAHEPDTFMGGFTRSLKDQILAATVGNPQLQGAAHPSSAGDIASLVFAPTDATRSATAAALGGPTGIVAATKEVAQTSPNLRSIPATLAKILTRNAVETAPTIERSGAGALIDRYAPNVTADVPRGAFVRESAPLPQGPAQAVKVQLPDGSWGLKPAVEGQTLTVGQPANVTLRSGAQRMETVPAPLDPAADVRQAKMLISSGSSMVDAARKASEGSAARFLQILKGLGAN